MVLCGAGIILSLSVGSQLIPPHEIVNDALGFGALSDTDLIVVRDIRLPRTLLALFAGGSLAVAGLLMQTLFKNPLADPHILGVTSGASLAVACFLLVGPLFLANSATSLSSSVFKLGTLGSAALGAFCVSTIIATISRKMPPTVVLIIGLMIAYATGALIGLLLHQSESTALQSFISWSFGSFAGASWSELSTFIPISVVCCFAALVSSKRLDVAYLGDSDVRSLGFDPKSNLRVGIIIASVIAGSVTAFCGPIAFIGIAAPHLAHFIFKQSSHQILILQSAAVGGLLALLADILSRGVGLQISLPLGSVTALIGAPFVIWILIRSYRYDFA